MSRSLRSFCVLVLAFAMGAALPACKKPGKDKDEFAELEKKVIAQAKPLLGIYQITAATRNPKVCTAEGPALKMEDRDGYVVLVMGEMLARQALKGHSCSTVAQCRKHAKKWEGGSFSYGFREITDGKLTARMFFTGFSRGKKICRAGGVSKITVEPDGAGIRIAVYKTQVDYPADAEGMCSTKESRKRTRGKPCNELTVYRAKKVAGL